MGDFEEKLATVMNDPAMMEKIAALAQSLGNSAETKMPEPPSTEPAINLPNIDISMLQKLSAFANQSGIDKDKQNLIRALSPYISANRLSKLERAMRAANMAGLATSLLGR